MANDVLKLDISTAVAKLLKAIRRMVGKRMAGGVVTLDVDSSAIRLLEIRRGVVRKWASVSLEPEGAEEETALGRQALGTMVRQLMASSGIKARKVIAGLSGLYSINRLLPMSSLPQGLTTQEAVEEVAKEIMPVPGDKLYLSWQTITAGEDEQQVLILGVPRGTVDDAAQALKTVGINPHILELRTMALTRAVSREQALILNIEPSSLDVIIVVNNIPRIMRAVAWQPGDLTEEDTVEHLAVTLEITVDFYDSNHPDTPLDPATPLFITGQMSADLTLMEKLQARLRYPVESLAPPLDYPESLPISQYAVNIGLALRGTALSREREEGGYMPLDINLLPESYRPWKPAARQLYAAGLIIVAIALLFPVFQVAAEAMEKTADLQIKFNVLNARLELQKTEIKRREPIKKAIAEFNTIINKGGNFTEDLEVIRSEAEELGVQVESITHEGGSISVTCQSDDYVTFRAYKMALEESGRFTTPIPPPEGYPYTTGGILKMEPGTGE